LAIRSHEPYSAYSESAGVVVPMIAMVVCANISLASPASADLAGDLQAGLTQKRAATSCAPLKPDPVADHVAAIINRSYSDWLDHASTDPPITDPLPGLKELGYRASAGKFLGGVSKKNQADAIKAALLEGYAAIPDCSYTDYGLNISRNEASGYTLAAVVLAHR
jgi:hypothetical protein